MVLMVIMKIWHSFSCDYDKKAQKMDNLFPLSKYCVQSLMKIVILG